MGAMYCLCRMRATGAECQAYTSGRNDTCPRPARQVTNNGTVAGAEVAQLYLAYPPASDEPLQVLRGFQKVMLQPVRAGAEGC